MGMCFSKEIVDKVQINNIKKIVDIQKIEFLNSFGISNEKLNLIHIILCSKGHTIAALEIRKLLRNGDDDPYHASRDEIYKNKIRALTEVYGKKNTFWALFLEKYDILHE
jgi:hypothetical protein